MTLYNKIGQFSTKVHCSKKWAFAFGFSKVLTRTTGIREQFYRKFIRQSRQVSQTSIQVREHNQSARRVWILKEFARSLKARRRSNSRWWLRRLLRCSWRWFRPGLIRAERVLDETVEEASRIIMTGQAKNRRCGPKYNLPNAGLCSCTYALFNCNNFIINVQKYSSFSSASPPTPDADLQFARAGDEPVELQHRKRY